MSGGRTGLRVVYLHSFFGTSEGEWSGLRPSRFTTKKVPYRHRKGGCVSFSIRLNGVEKRENILSLSESEAQIIQPEA